MIVFPMTKDLYVYDADECSLRHATYHQAGGLGTETNGIIDEEYFRKCMSVLDR